MNEEKIKGLFNLKPIQYLKSFLSINTHVGCNLGCAYCICHAFGLPTFPRKIIAPEQLMKLVFRNKYFIPNITPVGINNKSDPLLPEVKDSTFKVLKIFARYKLKNPLIVISKLSYSPEDLDLIESFSLNIYHFTSYSGLSSPLEKVDSRIQKKNIKLLSKRSIKSIHYWRPIIEGLNDNSKLIRRILDFVAKKCRASVISGIRLPLMVIINLQNIGINVKYEEHYTLHKKLSDETRKRIAKFAHKKYPQYPIFFHTSCALSYFENLPDYNTNYLKSGFHCNPFCKNIHICRDYMPSFTTIEKVISRFTNKFKVIKNKKTILIFEPLSLEDLSYLRYILKMKIVISS